MKNASFGIDIEKLGSSACLEAYYIVKNVVDVGWRRIAGQASLSVTNGLNFKGHLRVLGAKNINF